MRVSTPYVTLDKEKMPASGKRSLVLRQCLAAGTDHIASRFSGLLTAVILVNPRPRP
jgi:hypothetical protein